MPVLTAAKAQKKKVLFLLNDFDDTPAGVNPLITSPKLRTHLIDLLTKSTYLLIFKKDLRSSAEQIEKTLS